MLALLDTAALPGEDPHELIDQARAEVEQIGELIDEVLFLSELETGRAVVALASTRALPIVRETLAELAESALRAGVTLRAEGDEEAELPLRPRMLRVVVENLARNAIRYAGDGRRSPCPSDAGDAPRGRTTAWACPRTRSRACSSASTAPTGLAAPAAPASASRS